MAEPPRVGFIGVGFMGHGMARNIVEAGYELTVLAHRNRAPVEDLLGRGAAEAPDIEILADRSDVIFLCLPGSPEVEAAVDRILARAREGMSIVDSSTSNPASTRRLAARCRELGLAYVDAPLGRTPKEAWEGTLDAMVGATEEDLARLRPLFDCWAGRVIHVGEVGAGHTMKLLNNFIALGYAALFSEALAIGAKNGITEETFDGVIRGGRMESGFYRTFMKYVLERDQNAHKFALGNAHKDMRYLVSLANDSGIASHVSSAVKNNYATAEALGHGEDYLPMLSDIIRRLNGIEPGDGKGA